MGQSYSDLVRALIDAAFESGYYQATLEKGRLNDQERPLYEKLRDQAIALRNTLRDRILEVRIKELNSDIDALNKTLPPQLRSQK